MLVDVLSASGKYLRIFIDAQRALYESAANIQKRTPFFAYKLCRGCSGPPIMRVGVQPAGYIAKLLNSAQHAGEIPCDTLQHMDVGDIARIFPAADIQFALFSN